MSNKVVDQLNVPESFVRLTTTFSPDTKTTKFDLVVPGQPVMKTGMTYVGFELTLENLTWLRNTLTKYIGEDQVIKDSIKAEYDLSLNTLNKMSAEELQKQIDQIEAAMEKLAESNKQTTLNL